MVRSHGWSGNTPSSDEEAISRILDAADAIVAERGSALRIADVARALGVTRQTVYRYFPGTDALLVSIAMRSGDGFLERLAKRLKGRTDPLDAMVEGVAFAVENLSKDEKLGFLLTQRRKGVMSPSLTSETARAFGRSMIHRIEVDWDAHGFDEDALDELAEFCMRLLYSFLVDPGDTPRGPAELRRFLARWIGPAIVYPSFAGAVGALSRVTAPRRSRKRSAS